MDQAEWAHASGKRRRLLPVTAVAVVAGLLCVADPSRVWAQAVPDAGRSSGSSLRDAAAAPTAAESGTGQNPTPTQPADAQPKPSPPPVTAGWRDGFFVQSEKGDFRLQIGALVHADARFALADDNEAVTDTFLIRRLRPYLRGRLGQHFEFLVNPDVAGGTLVVQDAYLDTVFTPAFRLRVGKGKTPFGMERLHSAGNLLFFERALPTAIAPNRDVGIQVLGDIDGGVVSYLAGLVNGVPDGASADLDTSDSKDVAGRLVVRPFTKHAASPLQGLGLAIAGSTGRQAGAAALPAYRTPSLQQPFFSYTGATADGVRTRYSPQLFFYRKAFAALGEYVHSELPVRKGTIREDIGHSAWQVAASFVLTGEAATDASAGIRPKANFDFGSGHLGAWQIAARYHTLKIDDRAFTLNLPTAGSSRKAEAWTVGVNWYLTQNFKYVFNFERTVFDGDSEGARKAENALVFRTQVNF
jgi:phosphate-selective porin OprO/OprP